MGKARRAGDESIHLEAEVHLSEVPDRARHEPRPDEQHGRARDLSDDEQSLRPPGAVTAAGRGRHAQQMVNVASDDEPGRDDAHERRGESGDHGREAEHARVDAVLHAVGAE
jgi:hypothetical protein